MRYSAPLVVALGLLCPDPADAFCGAYVGEEGAEIHNSASRIVLAREGNISTLTMFNDFEGNASEFGMIIPVSSTIDEDNVALVDADLLDRLDRYSAPRLVQYTCEDFYNDAGTTIDPMVIAPMPDSSAASARSVAVPDDELLDSGLEMAGSSSGGSSGGGCGGGFSSTDYLTHTDTTDDRYDTAHGVTVEDELQLGEYELWVLRADDADGLSGWLAENGFVMPDGATALLDELSLIHI